MNIIEIIIDNKKDKNEKKMKNYQINSNLLDRTMNAVHKNEFQDLWKIRNSQLDIKII